VGSSPIWHPKIIFGVTLQANIMTQHPEDELSLEQSPQRIALVAAIGDRALLPLTIASSEDLALALNEDIPIKADSPRRSGLYPKISELGGKTLSVVDVVLSVQDKVDRYKAELGFVVEILEDEQVPQYLRVISKDSPKATRDALRAIWRDVRDERYPDPENKYQKSMATRNRKRPKKFDPSKSLSFKQATQAAKLRRDSEI
jgi:hypothetical protein